MCFSAPASFIASGGLMVLGGASLIAARKEDKILALIPLLFGVQQFLEGIQWIYLDFGSSSRLAGYGFMLFAFIIWPVYVPTFVYLLDTNKRQKILRWFVVLGSAVALYFLIVFFTQSLEIEKLQTCVSYTFYFPYKYLVNAGYLIAVFVPLFISSHHILKWFGGAIALMAIIAWLFFTLTFASVWCFFAAIVSSMFFFYIKSKKSLTK